ncbi:MAG: nonstructural protein [Microvirus sp.]|nr:MAG: nonstructural protein [Microvirus sp.]
MKVNIYAVRDRAIDTFAQPMFMASHGGAIRSFNDAVNDPKGESNLCKHPEDFDLYYLGVYDDAVGSFAVPDECPEMIAIGKNALVRQ